MSSSHNIVSALKAKAKSNSTTSSTSTSPAVGVVGGFDFVKVGTSSIPVSMLPIVDVNSPPYAKAAAFQSLETTIQSLSETQSVMELMMFVGTKLPIETRFALTEAEAVGQAIRDSVMSIDNLHGLRFFDSKMVRLETEISENLDNRTAGLYYARFASGIYGSSVDKCIRKDRRIHLEFSLKLPQTKYDLLDSSTQPLGSPHKTSRRLFETPHKGSEDEEKVNSDDENELDDMESEQEPQLGQVTPSFPSGMSPKMLEFTNSNNSCRSGIFRIGYYGKLDFFNTQEAFHITFGPSPRMFHATEEGELWNEQDELQDFINKFMATTSSTRSIANADATSTVDRAAIHAFNYFLVNECDLPVFTELEKAHVANDLVHGILNDKSLRKGMITLLHWHCLLTKKQSNSRSGHDDGSNQDFYYDPNNAATTYPGSWME